MSHDSAPDFPELRRVFSGYLHEDFRAESGTAEEALRRFWADADSDERRRFQHEVRSFLEHTAVWDLDALRGIVHRLGGRWVPPSRQAVVAALTSFD